MTFQQRLDDIVAVPRNTVVLPGYCRLLKALVEEFQPHNVVELGTGDGWAALYMMLALPKNGRLTTIGLPDDEDALRYLKDDRRLCRIDGDSREQAGQVDNIDMLIMDIDHTLPTVEEWPLYSPKLIDGAIVCVCDIGPKRSRARQWWDKLPYAKCEFMLSPLGFGVMEYRRKT